MEGSGETSTVFTWKKCTGSCKRRQCLFLQAVSAPCQADSFGASRSAPWAVTFFWGSPKLCWAEKLPGFVVYYTNTPLGSVCG